MFKNHIKEAQNLNKLNLENIDGYKLYYSKIKSIISLLINIIMIVGGFYLFTNERILNESAIFGLVMILFFTYFSQDPIGRLILKNPIFILTGEKIYYLKTNKWYNLKDYDVDDEFLGAASGSVYLAFRMKNKDGIVEFKERHWHLESGDEFRSRLSYYKILLNRK